MTTENVETRRKRLNIELLYLDLSVCTRCQGTESSLKEAMLEISQVLEATGVEVIISKIHVQSEEEAAALRFVVSPTIRINDEDIQMVWRESTCDSCGKFCGSIEEVSCREWKYQGQWYTIPPKGLIIDAVLRKVYGGEDKGSKRPTPTENVPDNLKQFFAAKQFQETEVTQNEDRICCSPSCCG